MSKRFWLIIVLILVAVGVIRIVGSHGTTKPVGPVTDSGASLAPSSIVSDIASVPETTLQMIGKGSASVEPQAITAPALQRSQKPEIFFEGAEYCPYCATERWPIAVALSKFGTFKNLKLSHSSTTDVYPDTHTLSFYNATYTSSYINFTSIELYSNVPDDGGYSQLQTPTSAEQALANKYDTSQSIPFIDFGGKYVISGATYSPAILQGKSWSQIAGSLANADSTVAQGVDGAANTAIAAICALTNNQPSSVCNSTIVALENNL
jgi:hypothetical protein